MTFRFDSDEDNERAVFDAYKTAQRLKRSQNEATESEMSEEESPAFLKHELVSDPNKTDMGQSPEENPVAEPAAPGSPDEYLISFGDHHDSNLEKKAREWFYQVGLPIGTAKAISSLHNLRMEQELSAIELEQERLSVERRLRGEWGDQGFEKRIGMVRELLRKVSPEAITLLEQSGLGNDEHMIRRLVRFAESKVVR
ncbi:hypothetical protein [Limibacillus sp. MBR-115]|jgi:hypothetical protein|uniref:hypothetical protein n=1 Tax=Limibacillus sp. MBR-115 TaxID=3156465 RepID=UPI0033961006